MKKFLRRFLIVAAALIVLGLVAVFCRDPLLKLAAQKAIHNSTGMKVEIARFKTGLRQAAIRMQGVKIYNYSEFGPSLMFDAPELLVELDQELAAQGKLRFKLLQVNLEALNIIRDTAGRWNVEKVEKEMTERNLDRVKHGKPKIEFAGIDELRLTIGRVTYRDLQKPSKGREILVNIRDELVTGIRTDEDLQDWIGSFIFKIILQEAISPTSKRKAKPMDALKQALDK